MQWIVFVTWIVWIDPACGRAKTMLGGQHHHYLPFLQKKKFNANSQIFHQSFLTTSSNTKKIRLGKVKLLLTLSLRLIHLPGKAVLL
jgi:hypothetical protein